MQRFHSLARLKVLSPRVFPGQALTLPFLSLMIGSQSFAYQAGQRSYHQQQKFGTLSKFLLGSAITGVALTTYVAHSSNVAECSAGAAADDKFADTPLYPPIQPYNKGFLKVSKVHTIAYSEYGNPKGKPVLCVHGGPGGGCNPTMARYFDPQVYRVILVDQRGCGDSTPFANLEENTTFDSIRDFEKIREMLKIEKWQLFGGSWGTTLSLAYAVRPFFLSLLLSTSI